MTTVSVKPMATLSVEGILTDPAKKANRIFANYLRSFYSQSTMYMGSIHSLSHQVKVYGNNPTEMANAVQSSLESLYGEYYDSVKVRVRTKNTSTESITYSLIASAELYQNGVRLDLNRQIDFNDGVLAKINDDDEASYD